MLISLVLGLLLAVQGGPALQADAAISCDQCSQWNKDREPFRLFGNSYYVGTDGLSAILITSDTGHILIDGDLPQSAALIDSHVRRLGFRTQDVRLIVASHAHFDHVGGIAALQRASGAVVAASPSGARAIQEGRPTPDDPQFDGGVKFPPVKNVRVVRDREKMKAGSLEITAHLTPGHTPGATAWTWRSCEGSRCLNMVYADSLNAVSADGFRFTPLAETFRKSIRTVAQFPCDILISVHPGFSTLFKDVERREQGSADALINPQACRVYAANARQTLDRRLAEENKK